MIYLDHNATTPILPVVAESVCEASLRYGANPGSQHEPGRQARRALEEARERIGKLLGARLGGVRADRVIFTSGGTEANNLALKGVMMARAPTFDGHLVVSAFEHPSIEEPAKYLEKLGCRVSVVGCNQHGVVDPDAVPVDRGRFFQIVGQADLDPLAPANPDHGPRRAAVIGPQRRRRGILAIEFLLRRAGDDFQKAVFGPGNVSRAREKSSPRGCQ